MYFKLDLHAIFFDFFEKSVPNWKIPTILSKIYEKDFLQNGMFNLYNDYDNSANDTWISFIFKNTSQII